MPGRARTLLPLAAIATIAAVPAGVSLAGVNAAGRPAKAPKEFLGAGVVSKAGLKGIVTLQPVSNGRARVSVSLHGLKPETSYRVVGSTTGDDSRAFDIRILTRSAMQDVFVTEIVNGPGDDRGPDRATVYELTSGGGETQVAVVFIGGGASTGA